MNRTQQTTQKLLLVEPHADVSAQLDQALRGLGYCVTRAANASEAEDWLAENADAIVVSNTTLPDESGWLFGSKLRLRGNSQSVWLYGEASGTDYTPFAGISGYICHQGNVTQIVDFLRKELERPAAACCTGA